MIKSTIIAITMATIISNAKAQDSNKVERCFPFGSSLVMAYTNSSGNKLVLENVYHNYKVFDLQTGKVIAFSNSDNRMKLIDPVMEPTPIKYFGPYYYRRREITDGKKREAFYAVSDSLGNIVMDVKDEGTFAFNRRNGNIVWAIDKKIILYEPGKNPRTVGKGQKRSDGYYNTQSYVNQGMFSPNGRYLVSYDGNITDLEEAKSLQNVFVVDDRPTYKTEGYRPFDISFNSESTTCTVSIHGKGLFTYQLSTGALVDSSLIPAIVMYPDLKDIFQIIQLPNSKDFIYWLRFLNKVAPSGIAYFIKDGIPLPLCDPGWQAESNSNFRSLIAEIEHQQAREKAAAEKFRKEQEAYAKAHPGEPDNIKTTTTNKKWVENKCGYCNASGKITFEKLIIGGKSTTSFTIDQYGNKTYKTTGGTGTTTCSSCNGKGYVRVYE